MKKKILNGQYLGLNFKYDTKTNTLNFTKGKLIWDYKGWKAPFLGTKGDSIDNDVPVANSDTSIDVQRIKHIHFGKGVDLSNVHSMQHMINGCVNLQSVSGFNNVKAPNIQKMSGMLENNPNLKTTDVGNLNTSAVKNMSNIFKNDRSLQKLDLSHWDTSNVQNMSYMFRNNDSLKHLNVSNWNTGKVTNMKSTFCNDRSLKNLHINHFDTHNVMNMHDIFAGDKSLQKLDLSHWDTSNVHDISDAFNCDYHLKNLKQNFDTHNVTNIGSMFYGLHHMKNLDVSNFDTSNAKDMDMMFDASPSLRHIKGLGNLDTHNNTDYSFMFTGDNKLNPKELKSQLSRWRIRNDADLSNSLSQTSIHGYKNSKDVFKKIGSRFIKPVKKFSDKVKYNFNVLKSEMKKETHKVRNISKNLLKKLDKSIKHKHFYTSSNNALHPKKSIKRNKHQSEIKKEKYLKHNRGESIH